MGKRHMVAMVDIHHHVLKSTTSGRGRMGDTQNRRSIWSVSSIWFIRLVSSNQIDQITRSTR